MEVDGGREEKGTGDGGEILMGEGSWFKGRCNELEKYH